MSKQGDRNERARWQWWVVFTAAPVAILLGTVGYWTSSGSVPSVKAWLDALYPALQLLLLRMTPVAKASLSLEVARWLAVMVFGLTATVTILRFFREELRQVRLQIPWPRHVVICGLGRMATQLIHCYRRQGKRVVVVASTTDAAEGGEVCQGHGVTLVTGDMVKPATLLKARVYRASHVIALSDDDGTNMAIVDEVRNLIRRKTSWCYDLTQHPVLCFAHLSDIDARTSLQASTKSMDELRCKIRFFDMFDATARTLLLEPDQLPLDHGGITETDPRQVHLVILGFGRMGRSVALRAAQLGHFANRKPLRISVIDREAYRLRQSLLFRYPRFEKTCQIEFHELAMESLPARNLLETWCADKTNAVSVAACFDRDSLGLEVALRMKAMLQDMQVPMFVRMSNSVGFASVLKLLERDPISPVHPFYMVEGCCNDAFLENQHNEDLAQAIHEDYRQKKIKAIQEKGGDPGQDISTRTWETLDDGLKDSNRQQADHMFIKLRALGLACQDINGTGRAVEEFTSQEIELLAEVEHNRWNAERLLAGWQYGTPTDKPRKISDCILPWAQLTNRIQEYDRDAVKLIPSLLRRIGKKACKAAPPP